jgi:hypothetical protein
MMSIVLVQGVPGVDLNVQPLHGVSTMARPLARPTVAVAATRPQLHRLKLVVSILFALAATIAVLVFARNAAPRHAEVPSGASLLASADQASTVWNLIAPDPTPTLQQATNHPARTKAVTKDEPDWSAFSLGVTAVQTTVAASRTGDAGSPAELTIGMSPDERARQIADAREVDAGPAPANYRPLIGALVPAGSGDGICR